ncbi:MAG: acylhydrolase [Clostridia bacterium]|nr:acylhydrolase [Clostridia bacterium]
MKNVLIYGDSNTWGYTPGTCLRYPPDVRWTGVCQRELGEAYHIIEEGLNARTSAYDDPWEFWRNGRDYLPACLISHKPLDLLVISLGTNDLKFTDAFGACKGVDSLMALASMVQNKKESSLVFPEGLKILVISPIELGEGVDHNPGSTVCGKYKESKRFMEFMPIFCKARGAELLNAADYAHPSDIDFVHMLPESHLALGKAVAAKIREMLG